MRKGYVRVYMDNRKTGFYYLSLRSCPLPIIPRCLSREEFFFPLASSAFEKKKKRLIAGYYYPWCILAASFGRVRVDFHCRVIFKYVGT